MTLRVEMVARPRPLKGGEGSFVSLSSREKGGGGRGSERSATLGNSFGRQGEGPSDQFEGNQFIAITFVKQAKYHFQSSTHTESSLGRPLQSREQPLRHLSARPVASFKLLGGPRVASILGRYHCRRRRCCCCWLRLEALSDVSFLKRTPTKKRPRRV